MINQLNKSHKFYNSSSYGVSLNTSKLNSSVDLNKLFKESDIFVDKNNLVLKYSKNKTKTNFISNYLNDEKLYKYNLERVFYQYRNSSFLPQLSNLNNSWYNNININFLRKERLYTKLKYSRSPAYDIVSGGAAALFAGLLGFLVSEKFGIELVDSGDFYYLFMYIVFLCFSIRPLLTVADFKKSFFNLFSLNRILKFYSQIFLNLIR